MAAIKARNKDGTISVLGYGLKGPTFTPKQSSDGNEATFWWENDAGLPNPAPVKINVTAKADKTYVDTELAKKADKSIVYNELTYKANTSYVDNGLAKKSDKTYVDAELAKKVNQTQFDQTLTYDLPKTYANAIIANAQGAIANCPMVYTNGYYPSVEVLGKTQEVGTGEKSPDNPYALSPSVPTKVTTVGKNLINISEINSINYANDVVADNVNKINELPRGVELFQKYEVVQTGGTVIESITANRMTFVYDDNTQTLSDKGNSFTLQNKTITKIIVYGADRPTSQSIKNFIVTVGNFVTPYEPYQAQEYTLPALSLNTWDSYDVTTGELVTGSKEITINGSEGWVSDTAWNSDFCHGFAVYNLISDAVPINSDAPKNEITADKFTYKKFNYVEESFSAHNIMSNCWLLICIKKSRLDGWQDTWTDSQKVTAFKTWLSTNNVTVVYETVNQTTQQLTSQEVKQNLNIYNDVTDTKATYTKDTNQVITQLTNAIVALGGNIT